MYNKLMCINNNSHCIKQDVFVDDLQSSMFALPEEIPDLISYLPMHNRLKIL